MTQPSEEDLELSQRFATEAFQKYGHRWIDGDGTVGLPLIEFMRICRSHFSPTPPIDHALGALERRLLRQAACVHIAVEKSIADDLSDGLKQAANAIRQQAEEIARKDRRAEANAELIEALKRAVAEAALERDELQSQIDAIKGQPVVAWQYEFATRLDNSGYSEWSRAIRMNKPNMPESSIRNLHACILRPTFPPAESETKGEGA